jgi:RHS repeat-associated protein
MGNMLSASNGFGTTFSYTYDGAARPKTLTSNLLDSQHPAAIFTADITNGYFPHGALRKGAFGNGLTQSNVYDQSLNPCLIDVDTIGTTLLQTCSDNTPAGNVLYLSMGYNAGTSNNGNIMNWTATGAQSFARTYGYDSLNRVSTMGDTVSAQPCRGLSWSYDSWGNRTAQTMTAGTLCNTFNDQSDANNHLLGSPYAYDAAGNMTHDASHSYTYDAENRLTAVDSGNTANYYYDAFGYRVHHLTSSTLEYVRDLQGRVVSEVLPSGGLNASYMYFGGQMVAEYSAGTTYFIHQDHLGSTRLVTAYPTPSIAECDDYYPYGEANANVSTCLSGTTTHYKFTADELDTETNLDHTWFRQNSSILGRWMTSDPAGLAAVNPGNPQSWNRYSYVLNNPLKYIDRAGLFCNYYTDNVDAVESQDFSSSPDECFNTGGVWFDPSGNNSFNACTPGAICIDVYGNNPPGGAGSDSGQLYGTLLGGNTSGFWSLVKKVAHKVGSYIPDVCSGGVYNSAGIGTSGPVSLGVSPHFQQADFGLSQGKPYANYSEGIFTELSAGEGIQGGIGQAYTYGYGQSLADSKTTETFLFGGVGESNPFIGGNASAFYATPSSFGISLSGNLLAFQGGVGAYVNVSSVASCVGF